MMQSAQTRSRRDANYGSVHCRRALGRSLLTQPQVSAILVVVGDVLSEQAPAMPLVEHDQEQDVEYSGLFTKQQKDVYEEAVMLVNSGAPTDSDD